MRDLLIAAALVALAFAIVAVAIFGVGDENTFVSPPEAVAEEFVRAIGHGRIEPARSLLASEAERSTSTREVRLISTRFRSRVGHLDDVEATDVERMRDSAIVRARIKGHRAAVELSVPLVRENGAWFVARVADMVAPLPEAAGRPVSRR